MRSWYCDTHYNFLWDGLDTAVPFRIFCLVPTKSSCRKFSRRKRHKQMSKTADKRKKERQERRQDGIC
jgi:hypothetical protein